MTRHESSEFYEDDLDEDKPEDTKTEESFVSANGRAGSIIWKGISLPLTGDEQVMTHAEHPLPLFQVK